MKYGMNKNLDMRTEEMWRAVVKNDESYDGKFLYGVETTKIFCRPSCTSKTPREDNVAFFKNAADAMNHGFRPCKRCRPDLLDFDPARDVTSDAKDIIDECFADREELKTRLNQVGLSSRHLNKLFEERFGMTMQEYVNHVKLAKAISLLNEGNTVTDTAFTVGFTSSSSFSKFFKKETNMSPIEYVTTRLHKPVNGLYESPLGTIKLVEQDGKISNIKFYTSSMIMGSEHANSEARSYSAASEQTSDVHTRFDDAGDHPGSALNVAFRQLDEYFAGTRTSFDFPMQLRGSDFQNKVLQTISQIPYGQTLTYKDVAERIGNKNAARAVGMALNKNPLLIVIPCHRVVGQDGRPVGYAGGIERKEFLLKFEQEHRKHL